MKGFGVGGASCCLRSGTRLPRPRQWSGWRMPSERHPAQTGSKIQLICDRDGVPISLSVSGANLVVRRLVEKCGVATGSGSGARC